MAPATRAQTDRRRIFAVRASLTPGLQDVVRDRAFSAHTDFQPIPCSLTDRPCRAPSKMRGSGLRYDPATRARTNVRQISAVRASLTPGLQDVVRDRAFSAQTDFQPIPCSLADRPCRAPSKMRGSGLRYDPATRARTNVRQISAVRASLTPGFEEDVRDRAFSAHTDFQAIPSGSTQGPRPYARARCVFKDSSKWGEMSVDDLSGNCLSIAS